MSPRAVVPLTLAVVGILLAVLELTPNDWQGHIATWTALVVTSLHTIGPFWFPILLLVVYIVILRARRDVVIKQTRTGYWHTNIGKIINASDRLVVLDAYQGHKHEFWDALQRRLLDSRPFNLIMMMLIPGDRLWAECKRVVPMGDEILEVDRQLFRELKLRIKASPYRHNKRLELLHWTGISPGPLIAWTIRRRETIGLGVWCEDPGATDNTPYLIIRRGPLFATMKGHYERILAEATTIDDSQPMVRDLT